MKVQILVNGQVVNTQIVSLERYDPKLSHTQIKRIALEAALEDRAIRISDGLVATFKLYDIDGRPIDESAEGGLNHAY